MIQTALPDPALDPQFYEGIPEKRALAWLLDSVIVAVLAVLAAMAFGVATLGLGFLASPLIFLVTGFVYRVILLRLSSATLGMRAFGIEIRSADGGRLSNETALLHTILYSVIFASIVGQIMSCAAVLLTPRHQTLGDFICGTSAVNKPL